MIRDLKGPPGHIITLTSIAAREDPMPTAHTPQDPDTCSQPPRPLQTSTWITFWSETYPLLPTGIQGGPLRNLDLLRSCAVLLVAFSHFVPTCLRWSDHGMGRLGVMVFFVHTSLVLMMSMERSVAAKVNSVRTFYLRRAFRIYPLSILTVLAVTCMHIPADPFHAFQHPSGVELLSNIALTQNLTSVRSLVGPLWSLPWEVHLPGRDHGVSHLHKCDRPQHRPYCR